jgi:hypothetical protein
MTEPELFIIDGEQFNVAAILKHVDYASGFSFDGPEPNFRKLVARLIRAQDSALRQAKVRITFLKQQMWKSEQVHAERSGQIKRLQAECAALTKRNDLLMQRTR